MAISFDLADKFIKYELNYGLNLSPRWEEVQKLLGNRVIWMQYETLPQNVGNFEGYIFDALACTKGTLGIQVASALRVMIPICRSSHLGRPILIFDHTTLSEVPSFISKEIGQWEVKSDGNTLEPKLFVRGHTISPEIGVFEDERYMIYLIDDGCKVEMHIYKK